MIVPRCDPVSWSWRSIRVHGLRPQCRARRRPPLDPQRLRIRAGPEAHALLENRRRHSRPPPAAHARIDYWEAGMDMHLDTDLYESSAKYQWRLIREYNRWPASSASSRWTHAHGGDIQARIRAGSRRCSRSDGSRRSPAASTSCDALFESRGGAGEERPAASRREGIDRDAWSTAGRARALPGLARQPAAAMRIYLLRHAIPSRATRAVIADSDRPLTRQGTRKMEMARAARAAEARFDVVLTSPLVRARQTARSRRPALRAPPSAARPPPSLRRRRGRRLAPWPPCRPTPRSARRPRTGLSAWPGHDLEPRTDLSLDSRRGASAGSIRRGGPAGLGRWCSTSPQDPEAPRRPA